MIWFKAILAPLSVVLLVSCLTGNALAQLTDPVDVHRSEWGARLPNPDISTYKSYGVPKPQYRTIVLHSTDMGYGVGATEAHRIQNYQMDHLNFSDIAYNFLIDSDGTIFEGRTLNYVPSHAGQSVEANANKDITKDPDYGSIGIAFSSGPHSPINDKQIIAAKKLINFFIQHPKFQVNRVMTHAEVPAYLTSRNLTPTGGDYNPHNCPGDNNLETLVSLRQELKEESGIPFSETAFRNLYLNYAKPQESAPSGVSAQ